MYLDLLENAINPALTAILEQDDRYAENFIFNKTEYTLYHDYDNRTFTFQKWVVRKEPTE